jgi:hypothetical protein
MKKVIIWIGGLAFLCAIIISTACSGEKDPTTGNLHIAIVDSNNSPVRSIEVIIATTWADVSNGVSLATGWTNDDGKVVFYDLGPTYYWFGVRGWKDYGAAQVYAAQDHYVTLQLNRPASKK